MTCRTLLFLIFQSCTQFATIFERCTQPAPTSLQNYPQKILQRIIFANRCQVLALTSWKCLCDFNCQPQIIWSLFCILPGFHYLWPVRYDQFTNRLVSISWHVYCYHYPASALAGNGNSIPPLFIVILHIAAHAVIIHIILRCRIEATHVVRLGEDDAFSAIYRIISTSGRYFMEF